MKAKKIDWDKTLSEIYFRETANINSDIFNDIKNIAEKINYQFTQHELVLISALQLQLQIRFNPELKEELKREHIGSKYLELS